MHKVPVCLVLQDAEKNSHFQIGCNSAGYANPQVSLSHNMDFCFDTWIVEWKSSGAPCYMHKVPACQVPQDAEQNSHFQLGCNTAGYTSIPLQVPLLCNMDF